MNLPATVPRCPGQYVPDLTGAWPFPQVSPLCSDCARRRQGIADYMAGAEVEWMRAPLEVPCPEILRTKEKRHAA